jgi:hypothetical protein
VESVAARIVQNRRQTAGEKILLRERDGNSLHWNNVAKTTDTVKQNSSIVRIENQPTVASRRETVSRRRIKPSVLLTVTSGSTKIAVSPS